MRALLASLLLTTVPIITSCARGQEPGTILVSGHVEATDVRISTKVGGRLQSLAIKEGDSTTPGQEIARIDTTDIGLALRQAEAERDQAAAELALRRAGARPQDIAEMQAQVESIRADLDGAERDLDRMQALLDRGSGTTKARDDARTRRDITAAKLSAAEEALSRLKAGSRVEEIEASRAKLASGQARIAALQQQIEDALVLSPLAGVVTEKLAEPGELLSPGAPIAVITDLADAWLTVYVGEPDLPSIGIGQEVEVATDSGITRKGRITFIASQAEFTPRNVQTRDERVKLVFRVKIGLDNHDGLYKPGMPAEARISRG